MTRVMAQGTFDILHPGHTHYLKESLALGDELYVVIARDSRMKDTKDLYMNEVDRREVVDALEFVDQAVLGSGKSTVFLIEGGSPSLGLRSARTQSLSPRMLLAHCMVEDSEAELVCGEIGRAHV